MRCPWWVVHYDGLGYMSDLSDSGPNRLGRLEFFSCMCAFEGRANILLLEARLAPPSLAAPRGLIQSMQAIALSNNKILFLPADIHVHNCQRHLLTFAIDT